VTTKIKKSVSSAKMQQQQASKEELKELDLAIEKLVNTFKIACESRVGKLMSVSLDCLQVSLDRQLSIWSRELTDDGVHPIFFF